MESTDILTQIGGMKKIYRKYKNQWGNDELLSRW
jgi:hypothetical protein